MLAFFPPGAVAEQASEPAISAAGSIDVGATDSCSVLVDGTVRCWGYGFDGELGYGNTNNVGADETPASVGPIDLAGYAAKAISAGDFHTCALLDDGTVRCWGYGADGRLGYGNTNTIGATPDTTPASVGPVKLGAGRTAIAITAGGAHTCAVLDNGAVRCWGFGFDGQLGYGNMNRIGDNETPDTVAPVDLGVGRTAKAITAGNAHTCALLDDHTVRCWGLGSNGQLGYGNTSNVGDVQTPGSVSPVDLGAGRNAVAISAGDFHTCAILDNGSVRCWGFNGDGELGYANTRTIGDDETPGSVGPVDLGAGRTAVAISAGGRHTCAILDDGTVRCWGQGSDGQLGYGNTDNVGDDETPGSVGPVDLGAGRTAVAISAGGRHTCALLDNGTVRCWGNGANGRLGYCSEANVGDSQTPGSVGPVSLQPGDGGLSCAGGPPVGAPAGSPPTSGTGAAPTDIAMSGSDFARRRGLRLCLAAVASDARREQRLLRHGSVRQRAQAKRRLRRARQRCLRIYGRTPGQVTGLRALTRGSTRIELDFRAPGTDGSRPPAARSYLVEQSLHPIDSERDFRNAQALCQGACSFPVTEVGGEIRLTVTHLRADTAYYYAIAARDNVSGRAGPRSITVKKRTPRAPAG
jgi:alpha-tubulin suppressor-like RCC1 family protein